MSVNRFLVAAVLAALLVISSLTLYNAAQTTTVTASNLNGYASQRAGEWNAGANYAGGNFDQHERGVSNTAANYAGGSLDQHERHAPQAFDSFSEFRQGEWQTGSNYAQGMLDAHERAGK